MKQKSDANIDTYTTCMPVVHSLLFPPARAIQCLFTLSRVTNSDVWGKANTCQAWCQVVWNTLFVLEMVLTS